MKKKPTMKEQAATERTERPFAGENVSRHAELFANHPHIHIVSSLIRPDGSRVNTHRMGVDLSKPTCRPSPAAGGPSSKTTNKRRTRTMTPASAQMSPRSSQPSSTPNHPVPITSDRISIQDSAINVN